MALKFVQTGGTGSGGAGGGTYDHNLLVNRGLPDQHTIESITGLRTALDRKYEKPFTGIPKTDLGFAVATLTDIDFLRKTDIADLNSQLASIILEITDARGGLDTLRKYIDTKVSYSEWSGGGGSGGGGGSVGSQVGYPINEKVVATEGQTLFTLPKKYRVGTGQLEVYYDGLKMVIDDDYREVDDLTVEFLFPLEEGHMVLFQVRAVINSGLHEEYTATAGQTIFRLNSPYGINQNILQVFRNGNLLRKGRDYREIDDLTIEMTKPMIDGDYMTFHQAGATDPIAGTVLESELGRLKINLGYTTMLLHDSTRTENTDYVDMFVDTFITDKNIDKDRSFEYLFGNNAISVRPIDRGLGKYSDFLTGTTVDTDIETFPDVIVLENLPGGADRHTFGAISKATPDGKTISDIFVIENQYRHRFTFYAYDSGGGTYTIGCEILKHGEATPKKHEFNATMGIFGGFHADIDSKGRVHVVYHEVGDSSNKDTVWYDLFDENGIVDKGWLQVSDKNYDAINPHIDVDRHDVAHIVFQSKRVNASFFNVDYVTVTDQMATSPKDLTIYGSFDALNPRIAVGTDDRARVVFESIEYDGTMKNLKLIILQNAIKMYEEFITTSTSFDNVTPDIDIASDNSLRVVWRSRRLNATYGIDFCRISTDNLVSSVKSLATGFACSRPRIAMDEFNIAHVVFNAGYTRSDTQNICYVMAYDAANASQIFDIASAVGTEYRSPNISIYGPKVSVGFISDVDSFRVEKSLTNYASAGSFEMIFDTQAEDSDWLDMHTTTVTPAGSSIEINYRLSNDKVGWSQWKPISQIGPDTTLGRYIHIRVTMTSSNADSTPELTSITVTYLPTFIEILSVKKPSAKEVDSIIPIAQFTGDVTFAVSRDGGTSFIPAVKDRVTDMIGSPAGRDIVVKAHIPYGATLDAWGAIW